MHWGFLSVKGVLLINGIVCKYLNQIKVYDFSTYLHCRRVACISMSIGRELMLDPSVIESLYYSALLHDLGKVDIPKSLLNRVEKLTLKDWKIIHQHPVAGAGIIQAEKTIGEEIIAGIRTHHERWNGKGYPYGLAGENIPLAGRIIAIADAMDAMTSARTYRMPLSFDEAVGEIQSLSGQQFDPYIVQSVLKR